MEFLGSWNSLQNHFQIEWFAVFFKDLFHFVEGLEQIKELVEKDALFFWGCLITQEPIDLFEKFKVLDRLTFIFRLKLFYEI